MYWSLRNWLMTFATQWGLDVELIEMTDTVAVRAAIHARQGRPDRSKRCAIPLRARRIDDGELAFPLPHDVFPNACTARTCPPAADVD
jgi:hypothetical protein